MSEELSYVLILAFVIVPLLLLIFLLVTALTNGWRLMDALVSLPFA